MTCSFCNPPEQYSKLLIKKYKYWNIQLSDYQCYLGWCKIVLNRHLEDLFDITEDERNELFKLTRQLRDVLKKLFEPDKFNYASLGNKVAHTHLLIVPRYSKKRSFDGKEFIDKRWGKNYAPYDIDFKIPSKTITDIIEKIRGNL